MSVQVNNDHLNLMALIASDGVECFVVSQSGNSGGTSKCIILMGGYAMTEHGEIVAPGRYMLESSFVDEFSP